MRQRGQLGFLVFAALFGLAGCADAAPGLPQSEPPVPADSPSVSQPEDPADPEEEVPTPEPLPLPDYPEDLTAEDTAENAILAAEYFLELMNYIQSTGDVAPFEEVAAQSCESCERYVERQEERYRSGGFSNGNHASMDSPKASRTEDGIAWVVASDWTITDGTRYDAEENVLKHIPGNELMGHRMGVQLIESEWKMLTFAKAPK